MKESIAGTVYSKLPYKHPKSSTIVLVEKFLYDISHRWNIIVKRNLYFICNKNFRVLFNLEIYGFEKLVGYKNTPFYKCITYHQRLSGDTVPNNFML